MTILFIKKSFYKQIHNFEIYYVYQNLLKIMLKSIFKIKFLYILGIALALFGCAKENPDLVNPPSNVDYINVRFINLAGDFNPRELKLDGNYLSSATEFLTSSETVHPSSDSGFLQIYKDDQKEYSPVRLIHFQRNLTYSYFALPSYPSSQNPRSVDTIITMTTSLAMPANTEDCYIKLFNAYPDSLSSFALAIGCPSAPQILSNVFYRQITQPQLVQTGIVALSIIRKNRDGEIILGTFEVNLSSRGQYAVIISQDENHNPKVMLLDEMNSKATALSSPNEILERYSRIRLINISQSSVSAIKQPGDVIANALSQLTIGNYAQVGACKSASLDSVVFYQNGNLSANLNYSFDVLKDYSIVIFDSATKNASNAVVVPPTSNINYNGKSLITVINATTSIKSFDLSMASRADTSLIGYSAGNDVAKAVSFSQVAQPVVMGAGVLPFSIFTSGTPYSLVFNGLTNVLPDKSYIIIVYNDAQNNLKVSIVENSQENAPIHSLENCSFLQFLQAVSGTDGIKISIPGQIASGNLYYSNSYAAVLPNTSTTISASINSTNLNIPINPDPSKRYSIIFSGYIDSPDYILLEDPIPAQDLTNYKFRFVNASNDFNTIAVTKDTILDQAIALLNYKTISPFSSDYQQKLKTFYFYDVDSKKQLTKISMYFTLGKYYTIVLTGSSKAKGGYSAMILQDY